MFNSIGPKEFIGRVSIFYKDEDLVYAYDEITHGLYKFSLRLREVNLVLSPERIHYSLPDRIIGITKRGSEIVLIPAWLNLEWIFYDVEKEEIRYELPINNKIHISCVITIGTNLFFVPYDIYNPISLFSLGQMKIIKSYETWYKPDVNETGKSIVGVSAYHDVILFHVMNTRKIIYMNIEHMCMIKCDIPNPIFSASIYKDMIWILPISGKKIYMANLKGEILDEINLAQMELKISVDKFVRIVATDENVFLLPIYGEQIYVYQYRTREIIQIKIEQTYFWRNMFLGIKGIMPYWSYIINNDVLHLLPCDYRYKKIHMLSLVSEDYSLHYGPSLQYEEYCRLIRYAQKEYIAEEGNCVLRDFLQYALTPGEKNLVEKNKIIGKKIWGNMT